MAAPLEHETSPYLRQHLGNPVDWYPFGADAFELAKSQDKPVFISIGYAACHWCHVMAHESFEDEETAALMNENFINIKVDREELPEVDALYMGAIHATGDGGGWPLSAFCDSEGKPFFMGTYFPKEEAMGRPSFKNVLATMSRVYSAKREQVEGSALALIEEMKKLDQSLREANPEQSPLQTSLLVAGGRVLAERADPVHGGLGKKPKFPSAPAHSLLARAGRHAFGEPATEAYLMQCRKMAEGGIHDHLGGGFFRYSTDERWAVPHFEKMLADQGQHLQVYADAYALAESVTEKSLFKCVIEETISCLQRDFLSDQGGLISSIDADTDEGEGSYYCWTPKEIRTHLSATDAIEFCRAYGVSQDGNFTNGSSVLAWTHDESDLKTRDALSRSRRTLFEARCKRPTPTRDSKVLAGPNAWVVLGLIRVWEVTRLEAALTLARQVAGFLRSALVDGDTVKRLAMDGVVKLEGTLEDYGPVALAFSRLAEVLDDPKLWTLSNRIADRALKLFYDDADGVGVFYLAGVDQSAQLCHRPEASQDGALPAGARSILEVLCRRGHVCHDTASLGIAETYLKSRAALAAKRPFHLNHGLHVLDAFLNTKVLVVSIGEGREELLNAARSTYAPNLIVAGTWAPQRSEAMESEAIKSGTKVAATAILCEGQRCLEPLSDPDALRAALRA